MHCCLLPKPFPILGNSIDEFYLQNQYVQKTVHRNPTEIRSMHTVQSLNIQFSLKIIPSMQTN